MRYFDTLCSVVRACQRSFKTKIFSLLDHERFSPSYIVLITAISFSGPPIQLPHSRRFPFFRMPGITLLYHSLERSRIPIISVRVVLADLMKLQEQRWITLLGDGQAGGFTPFKCFRRDYFSSFCRSSLYLQVMMPSIHMRSTRGGASPDWGLRWSVHHRECEVDGERPSHYHWKICDQTQAL